MEVFVDGGLFELILAVAFGYAVNFIFLKKYLLIIFSAISLLAPVALFFINSGELRYWIISICLINSILLIFLLWKQRLDFPGRPVINIEKFKRQFFNSHFKNKLINIYRKLYNNNL